MFSSILVSAILVLNTGGSALDGPSMSEYKYSKPPATAKCPEWWYLAHQTGWTRCQMRRLDRIMWRESRCDMMAWNPKDPAGGSFGLMQINGFWVKWLRNLGIIEHKLDLSDPEINLTAALAIWEYAHERHGKGWSPWGFYRKT